MSELEIIKIVFGILLSLGTILLFFLAFKLFYKYLVQEKRCTMKTKGVVKGYTFYTTGGEGSAVQLPKVYYNVNGKEYKVIGPKYKYYKVTSVATPMSNNEIEFHETKNQGIIIKYKVNSILGFRENPMTKLFPKGTEIDVYYDPNNPKLSYVLRYYNFKWLFWLMFIAGIFVLLVDLFVLFIL